MTRVLERSGATARTLCGLLCAFAFVLSLMDIALLIYDPAAHRVLDSEDGLVENLTFFFALFAALYILVTLGARRGRFWHVTLALGLLLLAGEEISWGQRIFNIAEPGALDAINKQHELNLHNIQGVHEHVKAVGLSLILAFGVGFPVLYRLSKAAARFHDWLRMPLFPAQGGLLLVYATVLMATPRVLIHQNPLDEIGEMIIAVAFLIFALRSGTIEAVPGLSGAVAPPASARTADAPAESHGQR
jgi:hypothetical protein